MNIEDVRLSLAKYKFNKCEISIQGKKDTYAVDINNIANVIIDRNYDDKHFFPLFQIDVVVSNQFYRLMQKNQENIYVDIDLQCGYFPQNNDLSNIPEPKFISYIKNSFYAIIPKSTPDLDEDLQKKIEKANNNKGMGLGEGAIVNLLLYNSKYIHNIKTIVNSILKNCTQIDALTYVLNKADLKNILISPPTKYKSYSTFLLTPISAIKQLRRICSEYGLHSKGTLIFFDLMIAYIIEKSSKCNAYTLNENKTTYLYVDENDVNSQKHGCYKNKKDKYNLINVQQDIVEFSSLSEIDSKTVGNNFVTINATTGKVNTQKADGKISKKTKNLTNVMVITGKNTDNASSITSSIEEDSYICNIGVTSVDLEMLSPNKQFILDLSNTKLKKYNGKYRIVRESSYFEKEGKYFIPHTAIQLKK